MPQCPAADSHLEKFLIWKFKLELRNDGQLGMLPLFRLVITCNVVPNQLI